MNDADQVAVKIKIFDKEYKIACLPQEKDSLLESARYLDLKMKEVRNNHKIIGADTIAVMAALNIANEYLQSENLIAVSKIRGLSAKLDEAINKLK